MGPHKLQAEEPSITNINYQFTFLPNKKTSFSYLPLWKLTHLVRLGWFIVLLNTTGYASECEQHNLPSILQGVFPECMHRRAAWQCRSWQAGPTGLSSQEDEVRSQFKPALQLSN